MDNPEDNDPKYQGICSDCLEDPYLRMLVKKEHAIGECSICGQCQNHTITVADLGKLIAPIVQQCFVWGDSYPWGDDDNGKTFYFDMGEPLESVVDEILGQSLDCHEAIVEAVIDAEDVRPQDGDEPFIVAGQHYVHNSHGVFMYGEQWDIAVEELKYLRRYFNPAVQSLFDRLFENIEDLYCVQGNNVTPVIRELKTGAKIYRARRSTSHEFMKLAYLDPYRHIGPPPRSEAKAGRMNAEGVAVFYGATDVKTCLAEMRPALKNEYLVITVEARHPLRVLDFTLLEKARADDAMSYFHPDYQEHRERHAFLKKLHSLISQPVTPGNENDYLITQTMAEYLAHVHDARVDGIIFASAQRKGGRNIVLFGDGQYFPVRYIDQSISLHQTESITYRHSEVPVYISEGVPYYQDQESDF